MEKIDFKKKRCWQKVDGCIFGKLVDIEDDEGNFIGWLCPVGVVTKDKEMLGRLIGFKLNPMTKEYPVVTAEMAIKEFGIQTKPDIVDDFADAGPKSKSKAYSELFDEWRKVYDLTATEPQYMIYNVEDIVD